MGLEADIYTALTSLVSGRVYPDTYDTTLPATFPLIVYQRVGGEAFEFVEQTLPSKDHARIQVVAWATSRLSAVSLMRSIRVALVTGSVKAHTYNAPVSLYEEQLKLFGSRCDFGVWYTP